GREGVRKGVPEFAGGVAELGGVEPDPEDRVLVWERLVERPLSVGLVEMAQEAHDQPGLDVQLALRIGDRPRQPADDDGKGDTARRVALRIEEHLDVADILLASAREIGPGQVVEILLGPQHGHALIVEIEKILQPGEAVGLPQGLDRVVSEPDAVALREREHQLRFEAALDMDVEFGLRQFVDERCDIRHARPSLVHNAVGAVLLYGSPLRPCSSPFAYDGSLPSMPSASQFMPAMSGSLNAWPSCTLRLPS